MLLQGEEEAVNREIRLMIPTRKGPWSIIFVHPSRLGIIIEFMAHCSIFSMMICHLFSPVRIYGRYSPPQLAVKKVLPFSATVPVRMRKRHSRSLLECRASFRRSSLQLFGICEKLATRPFDDSS